MSNNKQTVLIASDIFGMSDDFSWLLENINVADHAITVSPYQKPDVFFDSEQQAYECFQDYGGIDAYTQNHLNCMAAANEWDTMSLVH